MRGKGREELVQDLWLNNSEAGGKGGKKGRRRRRRRRPRPILRGVFFPLPGEREGKKTGGRKAKPQFLGRFPLYLSDSPPPSPPPLFFAPHAEGPNGGAGGPDSPAGREKRGNED